LGSLQTGKSNSEEDRSSNPTYCSRREGWRDGEETVRKKILSTRKYVYLRRSRAQTMWQDSSRSVAVRKKQEKKKKKKKKKKNSTKLEQDDETGWITKNVTAKQKKTVRLDWPCLNDKGETSQVRRKPSCDIITSGGSKSRKGEARVAVCGEQTRRHGGRGRCKVSLTRTRVGG